MNSLLIALRKTPKEAKFSEKSELGDSSLQDIEITTSRRSKQPAHYIIKICSFSQFSNLLQDANFESDIFEACGYKWKLSLYPNGNKERNGEGYISLYLIIAGTHDLPLGWEVFVNFKFFVFDQIRDNYLSIQEVKMRRFHVVKTEWGITQLLPLAVFNDPTNGYLFRDTCVFGVEVFVLNYSGLRSHISSFKELKDETAYIWKIDEFSSLGGNDQYSSQISMGGYKWKLHVYPKGDVNCNGDWVSLYLHLDDCVSVAREYVAWRMCIRHQQHDKHRELKAKNWFSEAHKSWGLSKFISLSDLREDSNGFLVGDTLIMQKAGPVGSPFFASIFKHLPSEPKIGATASEDWYHGRDGDCGAGFCITVVADSLQERRSIRRASCKGR